MGTKTEDMLDMGLEKCRICWEEQGNMITPCSCIGTVMFVHEACLTEWIEKSVKMGLLQVTTCQDGYSKVKCELCKGDIEFKYESLSGWLKCKDIKDKIRENSGGFICMLVIILVLLFIAILMLVTGLSRARRKNTNTFGIIFLIVFDVLILCLCVRFIYSFVATFFRGNSITIHRFKTKNPTDYVM